MRTRWRLLIAVILLACGMISLAWHVWSPSGVRVDTADATTVLSVSQDASPLVFKLSSAVDEIDWGPDSRTLTVLTKTTETDRRQTRHLLLFDLLTNEHPQILETSDITLGLATWPDGASVGVAKWGTGPDGQCQVLQYDRESGRQIGKFDGAVTTGLSVGFTSDPIAIAVSPDGQFVAAGTKLVDDENLFGGHIGGEVCVWNSDSGSLLWNNRTTHTDVVTSVAFSPDSELLASVGNDQLIRIWNAGDGVLNRTIVGSAWHGIASVQFSPNGKLLATGGKGDEDGGCVRIWEVATGRLLHRFAAFDRRSNVRLVFSGDGRLFATGIKRDSDGTQFRVHAWDPVVGTHIGMLAEGAGSTRTIAASPDGKQLAIGTYEGSLLVFNLNPTTGITKP